MKESTSNGSEKSAVPAQAGQPARSTPAAFGVAQPWAKIIRGICDPRNFAGWAAASDVVKQSVTAEMLKGIRESWPSDIVAAIVQPASSTDDETARRLDLVRRALSAMGEGQSLRAAAKALDVPHVTLRRYLNAHEQGGEKSLTPRVSPGRPNFLQVLNVTAAEIAAMAEFCRGKTIAKGVLAYADTLICRQELSKILSRGKVPKALRAAVAAAIERIKKRAPAPPRGERG